MPGRGAFLADKRQTRPLGSTAVRTPSYGSIRRSNRAKHPGSEDEFGEHSQPAVDELHAGRGPGDRAGSGLRPRPPTPGIEIRTGERVSVEHLLDLDSDLAAVFQQVTQTVRQLRQDGFGRGGAGNDHGLGVQHSLGVRQCRVMQPLARRIQRDRMMVALADVQAEEHAVLVAHVWSPTMSIMGSAAGRSVGVRDDIVPTEIEALARETQATALRRRNSRGGRSATRAGHGRRPQPPGRQAPFRARPLLLVRPVRHEDPCLRPPARPRRGPDRRRQPGERKFPAVYHSGDRLTGVLAAGMPPQEHPPLAAGHRRAHHLAADRIPFGRSRSTSSATAFEGRGVIVTGTGSGIGCAAALRFAQLGAQVLFADINSTGADAVVKEIETDGGAAQAVVGDLSDQNTVDEVIGWIGLRHIYQV